MATIGNGRNGWVILLAGVVAWDLLFEDTLSQAFARAAHSRSGPVVIVTWGVLTAHLFGVLANRYDPFFLALRAIKERREAK